MPDIEQEDVKPAETAGVQGQGQEGPGLGALLKAEREKRGLTHGQVSEMTRLRRHMIEALEAEAWDMLPPPVFVRGFVRSYAKALGLDEKRFLALYDEIAPIEAETPKLIPRSAKRKRVPVFLVVILILILAGILYAWLGYRQAKEAPLPQEERPITLPEKEVQVPAAESKEPGPATDAGEPAVAGGAAVETPSVPPAASEGPEKKDEMGERSQPQGQIAATGEREPQVQPAPVPAVVAEEPYVLKAIVLERTWLKISVDGAEPKEYIFQPGSRPQWKAWEGFEIMVGNAGGIEFEFNEKKIESLGEMGKVVRLRLPKEYQGTGGLD